jgi:hypothetical protein
METKDVIVQIIQDTRDRLEQKMLSTIRDEKEDTLLMVDAKFLDLNVFEGEFGPSHETH